MGAYFKELLCGFTKRNAHKTLRTLALETFVHISDYYYLHSLLLQILILTTTFLRHFWKPKQILLKVGTEEMFVGWSSGKMCSSKNVNLALGKNLLKEW